MSLKKSVKSLKNWTVPDSIQKFVIYRGPSMNPILKKKDILEVIPYKKKPIRCGDVVVFVCPKGGDKLVVHRVISIDSKGIRTRGDNNNCIDPWYLSSQDILGYVARIKRQSWPLPVHRGVKGQLSSFAYRKIHTNQPE